MAYANTRVPYSGGPQIFETGFGLGVLSTDHLTVTVDGVVDGLGDPVKFNFTYNVSTGQVEVLDSIEETTTLPATVDIRRRTPIDDLSVDFEVGADVTKRNLNRAVTQALMATQETTDSLDALDIRMGSVELDLGTIDAAVTTATTARDKAQEWAENPVDDPVETGQFSALHWAAKAKLDRLQTGQDRAEVETIRDQIPDANGGIFVIGETAISITVAVADAVIVTETADTVTLEFN